MPLTVLLDQMIRLNVVIEIGSAYMYLFVQVISESSSPVQQEHSIRQNQLVLLSLLADALVDLLCEDEIEVFRSSTSLPLSPLMATPHPKKDLADSCMPVIKNSQEILNKVCTYIASYYATNN